MDPVSYPTFRLTDGEEEEVRFSCGDTLRLWKEHQIDLTILDMGKGARQVEVLLILLAAGMSTPEKKYTAEQLAEAIGMERMEEVDLVVASAIKKAFPQRKPQPKQITEAAA